MNDILFQLYPDLPDNTEFIETVNNPVLLPFGGEVEMEMKIVTDANGDRRFFWAGRFFWGHDYVFYCEDC